MKGLNIVAKSRKLKFLFLFIGLVLAAGLFVPFPTINLWWREVLNSCHVILFFFVSFILYFLLSAKRLFKNTVMVHLAVIVLGLLIGAGIEVLQGLLQREASIDDLFRNLLGILSGLSFVLYTLQQSTRNKIVTGLASLGFLLLGIAPLAQITWDYMQREKAFPQITAFEEVWFSRFVHFESVELTDNKNLITEGDVQFQQFRFDPGQYPGIEVIELEKDWTAYRKLRFQVHSKNASIITMVLKVYDKKHNQHFDDRFNQRFEIQPGLNQISVDLLEVRDAPVARELNLSEVSTIQLFIPGVDSPVFLGLSNLYLEK